MIKSIFIPTILIGATVLMLFANLRQSRSQNREIGALIQENTELKAAEYQQKAADHRFDTQVAEDKAELDDWKRYAGYLSSWYDRAVLHIQDSGQNFGQDYFREKKPTPPAPRQPIITVTNIQIYIYSKP